MKAGDTYEVEIERVFKLEDRAHRARDDLQVPDAGV